MTSAAYDRMTHLLTVGGAVHANDRPRVGINVHLFAGQSSNVDNMNEVGVGVLPRVASTRLRRRS